MPASDEFSDSAANASRSSDASRDASAASITSFDTGAAARPPKYWRGGLSSFTSITYCGCSAGKSATNDAV